MTRNLDNLEHQTAELARARAHIRHLVKLLALVEQREQLHSDALSLAADHAEALRRALSSKIERPTAATPTDFDLLEVVEGTAGVLAEHAAPHGVRVHASADAGIELPFWGVRRHVRVGVTQLGRTLLRLLPARDLIIRVGLLGPDPGRISAEQGQRVSIDFLLFAREGERINLKSASPGLRYAHRVAKMLGGRLVVPDATGESMGVVSLWLRSEPGTPMPSSYPSLSGVSAFILSDDAVSRSVLSGALRRFGVETRSTEGRTRFHEALAHDHGSETAVRLAFVDLAMRSSDPLVEIRALRAERNITSCVVVGLVPPRRLPLVPPGVEIDLYLSLPLRTSALAEVLRGASLRLIGLPGAVQPSRPDPKGAVDEDFLGDDVPTTVAPMPAEPDASGWFDDVWDNARTTHVSFALRELVVTSADAAAYKLADLKAAMAVDDVLALRVGLESMYEQWFGAGTPLVYRLCDELAEALDEGDLQSSRALLDRLCLATSEACAHVEESALGH